MIKLYTAATPNGRKISIALEELEVPYEVEWVKLADGEQHRPEFKARNPNTRIPVITDDDVTVWESGAILVYLAEKFGRLLPTDPARRMEALTYTFFQAAHLGPNLGRLGQQFNRPEGERNEEMLQVFLEESLRVFGVFDEILSDGREYLAGEYSIADIMTYPWLAAANEAAASFFEPYAGLRTWLDRTGARPAVARGMKVPE